VKKRKTKEDRQPPLFWGMSPNQVVAYNLFQARQERRWTQAQAAEALEPHLGVRWTVAQVSAAERSVDGTRVRQFSADDIVAFAQAFELPVTYFFLPTRPESGWSKVEPGTSPAQLGNTMSHMIDVVFGDTVDGAPRVLSRLYEFMQYIDLDAYTDAQRRIFDLATHRLLAVVSRSVGRMGEWQDSLRAIANDLGSLQADVAKALTRTLPDVTEEQLTDLRPGDVDRH
jgi:transcriptional regulator with XRE-family HTH domain